MDVDIQWSAEKNAELKQRHGFGFERVLVALADGALLDERKHPTKKDMVISASLSLQSMVTPGSYRL